MALGWDEAMLRSNIERRNPGLIVIAYGTNEAGQKDLSLAGHRETMRQLIARFRQASPTATILVIGPPDRFIRTRKGWVPLENLDQVVEAQRQAAIASGAAFWDTRAKMGGKGSMRNWVYAGMAQSDYVHFTSPGYRMLGDAIFRDVISQYEVFLKARDSIAVASPLVVDKVAAERH
jgi:lysophospholipase L1-like esterase